MVVYCRRTEPIDLKTIVELALPDRATFHGAMEKGESWALQFLFAMAQTLARRLGTANRELGAMIASTHQRPRKSGQKARSRPRSVARQAIF